MRLKFSQTINKYNAIHLNQNISYRISLSQMSYWSHDSLAPVHPRHLVLLMPYPMCISSEAPLQLYQLVRVSTTLLLPENAPNWSCWIRPFWHSLTCPAWPLLIYLWETSYFIILILFYPYLQDIIIKIILPQFINLLTWK